MKEIKNGMIQVTVDKKWPRITQYSRLDSGSGILGCDEKIPFVLELNGKTYGESQLSSKAVFEDNFADYFVTIPELALLLHFKIELLRETVIFKLLNVIEEGDFRLNTLYMHENRLATGTAQNGDSYLRTCSASRANWYRNFAPGSGFNGWEDFGPVIGGTPEMGVQRTGNACIWNEGICLAFTSSIGSGPFISMLDEEGQPCEGRAGRFSVWPGSYHHRLLGEPANPLEIKIAVLGDYNKNGKIDWCDGAAWAGDQGLKGENPYKETILYKIYVDGIQPLPSCTFKECLDIIRKVHDASGGIKQIVYLVGWQYEGHDTGYPGWDVVNERVGGLEGLKKLIADALAYNCIVSLHSNLDDSYDESPGQDEEILSRDPNGKKHLWYYNLENGGRKMYSINHTLAFRTGFDKKRLEKLLEMLPIKESIHFDAHRPNETWLKDGTHISAECEFQKGMMPILKMYREKGIDITTEGIGGSSHEGGYLWGWHMDSWQSVYSTVMMHGRLGGYHRTGPEGDALGKGVVWSEKEMLTYEETVKNFYIHWMYAQMLFRKKMTDYRVKAWNVGIEAWYEDNTYVRSANSGHASQQLEAWYEGIQIARGNDRFYPWRENCIHCYSETGGPQQWTLPDSWKGARITAYAARRHDRVALSNFIVDGTTLSFDAPKGCPVVFEK